MCALATELIFYVAPIHLHLEGCPKPTTSQPLVTPHLNLFSGCDAEIAHLLEMRADVCHYCAILDMYAPCVVSNRSWNNDANMHRNCCTSDAKLFNNFVLSVSDEAFMLLVLINAGARWMAELKREWAKVRMLRFQREITENNVHIQQANDVHMVRNAGRGRRLKRLLCP